MLPIDLAKYEGEQRCNIFFRLTDNELKDIINLDRNNECDNLS